MWVKNITLNAAVNSFIESKKLTLNADKCSRIHIWKKTKKADRVSLKVNTEEMKNSEKERKKSWGLLIQIQLLVNVKHVYMQLWQALSSIEENHVKIIMVFDNMILQTITGAQGKVPACQLRRCI